MTYELRGRSAASTSNTPPPKPVVHHELLFFPPKDHVHHPSRFTPERGVNPRVYASTIGRYWLLSARYSVVAWAIVRRFVNDIGDGPRGCGAAAASNTHAPTPVPCTATTTSRKDIPDPFIVNLQSACAITNCRWLERLSGSCSSA